MDPAIVVDHVSKRFRRYRPDRPRTFQEAVLRGLRGLGAEGDFWALREVSLQVRRGEMVGVIGQNGAGKTTLLRLVGGVLMPDAGRISVGGRVGALIDLSAGFHPDLTGRENVYTNGIISGLTRREVDRHFRSIVEFAELDEFIDSPLRTYSTGMQLRLAFAVATHIQPEILLIDEILSVGDLAYQNRCLERIRQFRTDGSAILVVSHDTGLIRKLCDVTIWLRGGRVVAAGPPELVVQRYEQDLREATERQTPGRGKTQMTAFGTQLQLMKNRFGSQEMQITEVSLSTGAGAAMTEICGGDPLQVSIGYDAPRRIQSPIFSVTLSKEDGSICLDTNTAMEGVAIPDLAGTGVVRLNCERIDLVEGEYFVDVGVFRNDWAYAYDYHWHAYPLTIGDNPGGKGVLRPPLSWEIEA